MSPEIDLLNTYPVCGQERTDITLDQIEMRKDSEGRDVEVEHRVGLHVAPSS